MAVAVYTGPRLSYGSGVSTVGDEELYAILGRAFPGGTVRRYARLSGGVSARATRADVLLPNGEERRVVVRRPTHATREGALAVVRREQRLLDHCFRHGLAAPAPCHLDEATAAIVLPYLPGAPDLRGDPLPLVTQLAEELARIHAVPVTGLSFLERRRDSAESLVTREPSAPDATLNETELRAVVRRLWPWPVHNQEVLLHGDYWPGNVLFEAGRLSAVIDWEESELGDPLADVAIARLDLRWAFGAEAAEAFTERYRALTQLDFRNLPRWELLTALRPLGSLERWATAYAEPPISRPDINARTMAEEHRAFVQSALSRI